MSDFLSKSYEEQKEMYLKETGKKEVEFSAFSKYIFDSLQKEDNEKNVKKLFDKQ
ncbi:hypothetical protein [Priestia megaterium]|uniref:hypothetical protein n=1 Tax=Priestia megaterium TaxID=1404 RepID=UPI0015D48503|nr:hypothetical protein [Priestia megaterium]